MTSRIPDHQQQTGRKVPRERLDQETGGNEADIVVLLLNIRMYETPDLSPPQSLSVCTTNIQDTNHSAELES